MCLWGLLGRLCDRVGKAVTDGRTEGLQRAAEPVGVSLPQLWRGQDCRALKDETRMAARLRPERKRGVALLSSDGRNR